ncbi:MAG: GspH/FimT family pseudopilin [Pseudomonadota bacterium]|nr:GspH/FimT family pseudopilin [Pseudomonadota bacterium]
MRHTPANTLQRGLTLIELLVTMSIAVILLTIGVPSFVDMITSNTATSYANDLLGDINYARSEAITRGCRVVVCKGTATAVGSDCTIGNWEDGWKVFESCDNDQTVAAVSEVLRVHAALSTGWTLTGNGNVPNYLEFRPTGLSATFNNLGTGTFTLCKDAQVQTGNAVTVNKTGRARVDDGGCP